MGHTHVIEASNAKEFKDQVFQLAASLGLMGTVPAQDSVPTQGMVAPAEVAAVVETAKSEVKKAKAKSAPVPAPAAPVVAAEVEEDPFGETEKVSVEQCIKKLQDLAAEKGTGQVKEVLSKVGIAKVKEITDKNVPAILAAIVETSK